MWQDINIGPHGRFIFDLEVPHRPAHWMITAFSLSPTKGFGMIKRPIEVNLTNNIQYFYLYLKIMCITVCWSFAIFYEC